jgi:serine/threonine protein kinase
MFVPEKGSVVGGYALQRILGQGGFGVVYEARHVEDGRAVALKLMRPPTGGDVASPKRFRREVDIVRRLEHPRIVKIYDSGVLDDGVLYYAMELLEGRDLADHLGEDGALHVGPAVEIAVQTLEALASAHEAGVIHRDVKPANVFLQHVEGDAPDVRVLDFGIATMPSDPEQETLTKTGRIVGTPKYMAPETVLEAIYDPASDVYAFGLVFYEMLTGAPAFDGEVYEILRAQATTTPSIPESIRELPLGAWLARAMSKDPGERYSDAREAVDALRVAVRGLEGLEDLRLSDDEPTQSTTVQVVLSAVERLAIARTLRERATPADDETISNIVVVSETDQARWFEDTTPSSLVEDTDVDSVPGEAPVGVVTAHSEAPTPATSMSTIGPDEPTPVLETAGPHEPTSPASFSTIDPDEPTPLVEVVSPTSGDPTVPESLSTVRKDAAPVRLSSQSPPDETSEATADGRAVLTSGLVVVAICGVMFAALAFGRSETAVTPVKDPNVAVFRVESDPAGATFTIDESLTGRTPRVVEWPRHDFPIVLHFTHPNGAEVTEMVAEPVPVVSVALTPPRTRPDTPEEEVNDVQPEVEYVDEPDARRAGGGSSNVETEEDFDVESLFGASEIILVPDETDGAYRLRQVAPLTQGSWWTEAQARVTRLARPCMPGRAARREKHRRGQARAPSPLTLSVELALSSTGRIEDVEVRSFGDDAPPADVWRCVEKRLLQERLPPLPDEGKGQKKTMPIYF